MENVHSFATFYTDGFPNDNEHEDMMTLCWSGGTFGLKVYRNQTMNGRVYNDLLVDDVLPELKNLNGGVLDPFIWQQDGAPCTVV